LEDRVRKLNLILNSEQRAREELEKEHSRRIEGLERRVEEATGGQKASLLQELKAAKEAKGDLYKQQQDLERERHNLQQQLKEEERQTQQLQEETKRKEEEKKKLEALHREKMRDLKRKLAESVMQQERTSTAIGEEEEKTGKLQVEGSVLRDKKAQLEKDIDTELTDKDQIKGIKKKT